MTFQVIESFMVKIAGVETTIKAGAVISLPEGKAIPLIETGRIKPIRTSTPPAPDTDLLNISVTSWLEKLSDSERDAYLERAAIMEYDGNLPREQAEVLAIKRIIGARVIVGKCDRCERVSGCMLTPKQRALCQVK